MRLRDFIVCTALLEGGSTLTKPELIRSLLTRLVEAGYFPRWALREVEQAILHREALGSTGVGKNVALPRTSTPHVTRCTVILAVVRSGVEFDSLDGEPVNIVSLMLRRSDAPGEGLQADATIARSLREDSFRRLLLQARSPAEIASLILEDDQEREAQLPHPKEDWQACTNIYHLFGLLGKGSSNRCLRFLAAAFCRRAWAWLADERSRAAVEVAERYADQMAGEREFKQACDGAAAAQGVPLDPPQAKAAEAVAWSCQPSPLLAAQNAAFTALAAENEAAQQGQILQAPEVHSGARAREGLACDLVRELVGNPFLTLFPPDPAWLTWNGGLVPRLARSTYQERKLPAATLDPARLAELAKALHEAGCDRQEVLAHLREQKDHVRGCWAVDWVLGQRPPGRSEEKP